MILFENDVKRFVVKVREAGQHRRRVVEEALCELRTEVRSSNTIVAKGALVKLLYIYICGFDISWATFSMMSMIAQSKLHFKRVGYLCLSLTIHNNKELAPLLINSLLKDMSSLSNHITIAAMDAFAYVIDEEIVPNVINDIANFLSSCRPQIQRRAVALLYFCLQKSPNLIPRYASNILACFAEKDRSVQIAAIGVLAELSSLRTSDFPFNLEGIVQQLTLFSNNFFSAKALKILCTAELTPRELKVIEERICQCLQGKSTYSLLFESLRFASARCYKNASLMKMCAEKLHKFLSHKDKNIQYMSLCILLNMLNHNRELVVSLRAEIAELFQSNDLSIKYQAAEVFIRLTNAGNLKSVIGLIVTSVKRCGNMPDWSTSFTDDMINKIVEVCSSNNYTYVSNFEWYIDTLLDLIIISIELTKNNSGPALAEELLAISLRVPVMREYLVRSLESVLSRLKDSSILGLRPYSILMQNIVWICAEFAGFLVHPFGLLDDLQKPWVFCLDAEAQSIVVHSSLKLFSFLKSNSSTTEEAFNRIGSLIHHFERFTQESNLQLLERAYSYSFLLKFVNAAPRTENDEPIDIGALFHPELKQVSADAQLKVAASCQIDLDVWINKDLNPTIKPRSGSVVVEPSPETVLDKKKSTKSKHKKRSSKPHGSRNSISTKKLEKDYPEQVYKIAPLDSAEDLTIEKTLTEVSKARTHVSSLTAASGASEERHILGPERSHSVIKTAKSENLLCITIDSFLTSQISASFSSSCYASNPTNHASVATIVENFHSNFSFEVIDQSESAVLGLIGSEQPIYLLATLIESRLHLHCKSQSQVISLKFWEFITTTLFK